MKAYDVTVTVTRTVKVAVFTRNGKQAEKLAINSLKPEKEDFIEEISYKSRLEKVEEV